MLTTYPPDLSAGDAVLNVAGLTVTYGRSFPAVRNVSFAIGYGSTLALVGESGSGKTTIALALARLLPAEASAEGNVLLRGRSLFPLREQQLREIRRTQISFIFQDPRGALLPTVRIGTQMSRVVAHRQNLRDDRKVEAVSAKLLTDVGLPDVHRVWRAYARELSGGMCQRVMIALALAAEPALVIADEPLSALDAISQARMLTLLLELQKKLSFAMLYVTHDLRVASSFPAMGVLHRGQLVDLGPTEAVVNNPSSEYSKELVAAARALSMHGTTHT